MWLWFVINLFFPSWVASTSFQWYSKTHPPTLLPPSFKSSPDSLLAGLPAERARLTLFFLFGPYSLHTCTCTELLQGSMGMYYAGIEKRIQPCLAGVLPRIRWKGGGCRTWFAGTMPGSCQLLQMHGNKPISMRKSLLQIISLSF